MLSERYFHSGGQPAWYERTIIIRVRRLIQQVGRTSENFGELLSDCVLQFCMEARTELPVRLIPRLTRHPNSSQSRSSIGMAFRAEQTLCLRSGLTLAGRSAWWYVDVDLPPPRDLPDRLSGCDQLRW